MWLDLWGHVGGDVLWLGGALEGLHADASGDTLHVLLLEMGLAVLLALGEGDVEWLEVW